MKLEQTFEVQAPLAQVWAALNDLERVAPCLPGAAITGHDEDGTYHGTFTVKLGPMTAAYNGTIKIEDVDEAAHRATLKARGTDKRGQGGANATIVNTLSEHDGGTRVEAVTDFNDHRPARAVRPRRDDAGHLEPPAARLRDLPQTRLVDAPEAEAEPEPEPPTTRPRRDGRRARRRPPRPATPPPAAAPLKGGSLFFSVLWERIKRIFSRK